MNPIKEAFDSLPIAACFFDSNGIVCLVNHKMLSVGNTLFGSGIQTLSELHMALENPPKGIVRPNSKLPVYYFPDGTALRFEEKSIISKSGMHYTQVTAADVTELMARRFELEKENARLEDANRRARQLYEKMPEIVRDEEILAIKMRVHDDIGHSILSARRALLTSESIDEIQKNAPVWEKAIQLLHSANNMPEPEDPIEYALKRSESIGVDLEIRGKLPDDKSQRYIFSLAIRECITNCVRHAGGTKVFVEAGTCGSLSEITITNNGSVPKKEITEGGGLSALRRRVEKSGGEMLVQSLPRFSLTVRLPETEDE